MFLPTLLSCSSRFLRALQQNRAHSRLLFMLIKSEKWQFLPSTKSVTYHFSLQDFILLVFLVTLCCAGFEKRFTMEKYFYCSFRFAHYIDLVISRIETKGPVNASKIFKATTCDNVACNVLHTFGHPVLDVATCWMVLDQVWKWSTFCCNIFGCCKMLCAFGQLL